MLATIAGIILTILVFLLIVSVLFFLFSSPL